MKYRNSILAVLYYFAAFAWLIIAINRLVDYGEIDFESRAFFEFMISVILALVAIGFAQIIDRVSRGAFYIERIYDLIEKDRNAKD